MSKKSWERKKCDGRKFNNPECKQGVCSLYPYRKRKKVTFSDRGQIDTS